MVYFIQKLEILTIIVDQVSVVFSSQYIALSYCTGGRLLATGNLVKRLKNTGTLRTRKRLAKSA